MDGRQGLPGPTVRAPPCPPLPGGRARDIAFDVCRATLENVDNAATSYHPGSPPARYRLTPSSPPRSPVPGQAPSRPAARPPASASFPDAFRRSGIALRETAFRRRNGRGVTAVLARLRCGRHRQRSRRRRGSARSPSPPCATKKEPGTGRARSVATERVSRESDQKLRRGPIRNDLSFSATRASAARPKFCVNLYWPETPSEALRSTWSSFS